MKRNNFWWILFSVATASVMILGACKPAGPATPSPAELAQQVASTQMAKATEMAIDQT